MLSTQIPTYQIFPSHLFHCLHPPKWSSCQIGCQPFPFSKISPKCLTSNPLSQIATSNPRLQPDTHFAVDMFPYKKTELFQKSGFRSKPPKKPGNTPLSGTYLSFLDIKTTVSTCPLHGNISTVRTRSTWYPLSPRYFTSLARVAESQLT